MIKRSLIIAVCFILTLPAVWAQTKGRIEGRVLDGAGQPLEKAAVTVVSQKTSSIHYELTTDTQGGFMQIGLPPGNYVVSAKKDGFAPSAKEIHVSIAETTAVDFSLKTVETALEKTLSRADALFLRGNKFYAEQKYAEAADSYEEAIKLDVGNWRYFLNLGLARKKMNRAEEGLAAFLKAVELNPESYSANKEAGESLAKTGRFSEAKPLYEKAAALSPGDADAPYNLGVCLINLGESEAALPRFQKAVELNPDHADAYYQLGTILIGQNRAADAVVALEKFLALAPGHEKAGLAKQLLEFLKK
jgi:tetratricopeptide (TPR) repeat protein